MKTRYLSLFLAVLVGVSAAATTLRLPIAAAVETEVLSRFVTQDLPLADPASDLWSQATPLDVPLSGQVAIAPKNEQPSITSMRVRSLNNGQWVAFLLEWNDPSMDVGGGLLSFKDSAAIQFPSEEGEPFYCMGLSEGLVNILHWRADFQRDIEVGVPNAADIFPNMWVSINPGGDSARFLTAQSAGNPMSLADRTTPVEDLVAGGFGTLASQPHGDAVGWATWADGQWKAVIARPMTTTDAEDAQFAGGMQTSLALAAWDGGQGEVDGSKSVSTWVTLQIEAGPQAAGAATVGTGTRSSTVAVYAIGIIFAIVATAGVTWALTRRS